jgi:hypothetical protein
MVRFPKLFAPIPQEYRAQSNGIVLGAIVGSIAVYFLKLSFFGFSIFLVISMGLLGIAFAAVDAMRVNAGRPPVGLRALFYRGLLEAAMGFALLVAFTLVARAT